MTIFKRMLSAFFMALLLMATFSVSYQVVTLAMGLMSPDSKITVRYSP